MTVSDSIGKKEVFIKLRREILAARLRATLDEQLGRVTPETVKRLAGMKLPALPREPDEDAITTLRRLIPLARLRVTLDEQLGRDTPSNVRALSKMDRPARPKKN